MHWLGLPTSLCDVCLGLDAIHLFLNLLLIHEEKKAPNRADSLSFCWLISSDDKGIWKVLLCEDNGAVNTERSRVAAAREWLTR